MKHRCVLLAAFFLLIALSLADEDYYAVLGIPRDAAESEVHRAYKKLSQFYSPDKNPGDANAAEMALRVNKAYEVLSDHEKRNIYNHQGEEGLERMSRGGRNDGRHRGPDARADVHLDLEEFYSGTFRDLSISRNVICNKCRGTGAKDGKTKTCPRCQGRGVMMQNVQMGPGFTVQMQTTCDQCGGKGVTFAASCPFCQGRKTVPEQKVLKVVVERGMLENHKVVFERESEQHPDIIPGDVVFTLKQNPHPLFKRVGNDLYIEMKISLEEALLGFSRTIRHLDGHTVEVKSDKVIQPFSSMRIEREGMPIRHNPSEKGNLFIKFVLEFPTSLSQTKRSLLNEIF